MIAALWATQDEGKSSCLAYEPVCLLLSLTISYLGLSKFLYSKVIGHQ
ncbi:hypothetical protein PMIT1323_00858 [Prochlorococcus marinus str. MIT 1323]|nr:hypothetical protein PMIT1323_00858 [Prochlorococcus marinus str. MIT 1323]